MTVDDLRTKLASMYPKIQLLQRFSEKRSFYPFPSIFTPRGVRRMSGISG